MEKLCRTSEGQWSGQTTGRTFTVAQDGSQTTRYGLPRSEGLYDTQLWRAIIGASSSTARELSACPLSIQRLALRGGRRAYVAGSSNRIEV